MNPKPYVLEIPGGWSGQVMVFHRRGQQHYVEAPRGLGERRRPEHIPTRKDWDEVEFDIPMEAMFSVTNINKDWTLRSVSNPSEMLTIIPQIDNTHVIGVVR